MSHSGAARLDELTNTDDNNEHSAHDEKKSANNNVSASTPLYT